MLFTYFGYSFLADRQSSLRFLGTHHVPSTLFHFYADLEFVQSSKISYVGKQFRRLLLGAGLVEKPKLETSVRSYALIGGCPSSDDNITELGGERTAVITLAEFLYFIVNQKCNDEGILQTNGDLTIAYVRNRFQQVCEVFAHADGISNGWGINAQIVNPRIKLNEPWEKGDHRVLSRVPY